MNALDIEIAVAEKIGWRTHLIVPNVWWGLNFSHELDLAVLSKSGRLWEVEIKVSKADLKKDLEKRHWHNDALNRISRLYFAIPETLLDDISILPDRVGIYVVKTVTHRYGYSGEKTVTKKVAIEHRKAKPIHGARQLTQDEIFKLHHLAAMRIWSLKKKLAKE